MDPALLSGLLDALDFVSKSTLAIPIGVNKALQAYLRPAMVGIFGFMTIAWIMKKLLQDDEHILREFLRMLIFCMIVVGVALFSSLIHAKVVTFIHFLPLEIVSVVSGGKAVSPTDAAKNVLVKGYELALLLKGNSSFFALDGFIWVITSWVSLLITGIIAFGVFAFAWVSLVSLDVLTSFAVFFVVLRVIPPFQSLLHSAIMQVVTYTLEIVFVVIPANMFLGVLLAFTDTAIRDVKNGMYALVCLAFLGALLIMTTWKCWTIARNLTGRGPGYMGGLYTGTAAAFGLAGGAAGVAVNNAVTRFVAKNVLGISKSIGGAAGREFLRTVRSASTSVRSRSAAHRRGLGGNTQSTHGSGNRYPETRHGNNGMP